MLESAHKLGVCLIHRDSQIKTEIIYKHYFGIV